MKHSKPARYKTKHLYRYFLLMIVAISVMNSCAFLLIEGSIDPASKQSEDGLPVFYLHPLPKAAEYAKTTLYYKGIEYDVQAKTRGESSLWYPMKSFTVQFPEEQLFSDSEYGFTDKRKIILITSFDDNSCIRQRLAFDMWNRMAADNVQIATYSAVVYGNGNYHGLYTVCDHIDADLMQENGLAEDGNLYKTISWDADFRVKSDQHKGFEKKEGLPIHGDAGAFSDLDELILFVDSASESSFTDSFDIYANSADFMNSWILLTILYAMDSQVKNLYYYHNPGDLWKMFPWDFNCSFGQDSQTRRINSNRNNLFGANRIFERFTSNTVSFQTMTENLVHYISGGSLDLAWILDRIDNYYAEIAPAARKNEQKWSEKHRSFWIWDDRNDFRDFESEIQYIRQWITERSIFLQDLYD